MPTTQRLASIQSYHAHIYFEGAQQLSEALRLREEIADRFTVLIGRVHEVPIGPHAKPMFQVVFTPTDFTTIVPWLMLNRRGLTILIHPNTRQPKADHLTHAMWMGEVLDIKNLHMLPESEPPEPPFMPNTRATVAA